MPEPTSSTAIVATVATGVGIATLMPGIDGNAMFGAVIGAALIAMNQAAIKVWQRLAGLFISGCAGYVSAGEIVAQTPITQTGPAGFVGAIIVVPIALKAFASVDKLDLGAIVKAWFKPGSGG